MNLHLLPADHRLFIPKFIELVKSQPYAKTNILFCYVREIAISDIKLLFATPDLVINTIKNKNINRVIFHSLQPQAFPLIEAIKEKTPECRIDWVYWGETYDNPSSLMGKQTIIEYIKERGAPRRLASLLVEMKLCQFLLDYRASKFRHRVSRLIKYIDTFYHWSQIDYENIKKIFKHNQLKYEKFFYDIFSYQTVGNHIIEAELDCDASNCIIIGHSASMRNNHLDILSDVADFAVKNNKIIICPLSYGTGSKKYVQAITKYLNSLPKLSYRILNNFYPETEYFTFLSRCGVYIAPGRGSLGAGNMIVYALAGRVPVADDRNTVGNFLKSIGADVLIYKNPKDINILLKKYFGACSGKNKVIILDYFSKKNHQEGYEKLLSIK